MAATGLSAQILGPGMWGAIFLGAGVLVAASPYYPPIRDIGRGVALVTGILALLAVALGLLAATIGGSFRLPNEQAMLLVAFSVIGIFGITVFKRLSNAEDVA
ncbi:MAG: hypothetical protein V2J55_21555 [Candidatus Competibacteraceae bacterium]|jgi:hypothetical protein|nr:hypothetical protein [Candidatus Competibacteraceae bacterium]